MVLNMLFVFVFDFAHWGLALATSMAAMLNAGLLLRGLIMQGVFKFQPGWGLFLMRLVIANILMCTFLYLLAGDWEQWLAWGIWKRIIEMSILCFGGFFLYGCGLFVTGMRVQHFRGQE
jgi:putative peptidoglycan lipid II flippase